MLRVAANAPLTDGGPVFAADPPDAHVLAELDGLTALYHRPSGMTHILAPPAPQILAALAQGPAGAAAILRRIAAGYDVAGAEQEQAVLARLAELENAGLARRA